MVFHVVRAIRASSSTMNVVLLMHGLETWVREADLVIELEQGRSSRWEKVKTVDKVPKVRFRRSITRESKQ